MLGTTVEDWLLKEQENHNNLSGNLNQAPLKGAWFDLYQEFSIVEYFPIHEYYKVPTHG